MRKIDACKPHQGFDQLIEVLNAIAGTKKPIFFFCKSHLRGELKNFYSKILIVGVVSKEMRIINILAIPHTDRIILRRLDGIEAYIFLAMV